MPPPLAVIAVVLLVCLPFSAQAKPKQCFTATEINFEREVRHGIYLREAALRCQEHYVPGAVQMWRTFEEASASKFRTVVAKRGKAWQREYPDDWKAKLTQADGAIVTFGRNIPINEAFCANIKEMLTQIGKRGYGAFAKQAKVIRNEVTQDYRLCP